MKPLFRFGQPIGTALVIVGFVETIYSLHWLLFDCVSLEHTSWFNYFSNSADFEFYGHLQWHFWLVLHVLLSCIFWVAVIFKGRKYYLYTWLVISLIHNVAFVVFIILQIFLHPRSHDQSFLPNPIIGGLSLTFFILWRVYTMSVACQGLRRLNTKYDLKSDSVSDLDVCLEPLGYGAWQTWAFFKDLPGAGAVTLLTAEMVKYRAATVASGHYLWNVVNLCIRPLVMQIFGQEILQRPIYLMDGASDFLQFEETAVRCARVVLDCVGLYFLNKEKSSAVRVCVIFYFFLFVISNTAAGLVIANWMTEPTQINVIVYHICNLVADNVFRIFVLYFTIKYAMVHVRTIVKL